MSHLAKRYAISSLLSLPWSESSPQRDANGKPSFPGVAFNVSHQDGIVALVAVTGYCPYGTSAARPGHVEVGIDVVSTTERRDKDRDMIIRDGGGVAVGFRKFMQIYEDVFASAETDILMSPSVISLLESKHVRLDITDMRLRAFYTLWCLREAYVKMTGEALLAPWLKDLVFSDWQAPITTGTRDFEVAPGQSEDDTRGLLKHFRLSLYDTDVLDINIVLRSMGRGVMVATCLRTPQKPEDGLRWSLGRYKVLDMGDILGHAEQHP